MWYIRQCEIKNTRGYKYVGGFKEEWEAIVHKALMFPWEPMDKSRIEWWEDSQRRQSEESVFVRADRRQIDKFWSEDGRTIETSRENLSEDAKKVCGL